MDWYTTSIADAATRDVLSSRVEAELARARAAGTLKSAAQVYLVEEGSTVRLYFNEPARQALPALGGLAHRPSSPPHPRDMAHSLISR